MCVCGLCIIGRTAKDNIRALCTWPAQQPVGPHTALLVTYATLEDTLDELLRLLELRGERRARRRMRRSQTDDTQQQTAANSSN